MSLQVIYVLDRHVVDIIIKPEQGIHLLSELRCFENLLEPLFDVLFREEYLPSVNFSIVSFLIFNPKASNSFRTFLFVLLCLSLSLVLVYMSFFCFIFFLCLLVNENNILESLSFLIEVKCWHCFLLFKSMEPFIGWLKIQVGWTKTL